MTNGRTLFTKGTIFKDSKLIDRSLISKINKKQSPLVYSKNHYLQKTLKFKQWMNSNNPQRQ